MLTVVIIPTFNLYKNIGKYKWHPADKTEQNCIWYCSCTFDTFGYICSRQCQPYDYPHSQCLFVGTDLKILLIVIHKSPPKFFFFAYTFSRYVRFLCHASECRHAFPLFYYNYAEYAIFFSEKGALIQHGELCAPFNPQVLP